MRRTQATAIAPGERELLEALGDSREAALRNHGSAIARLTAILDSARANVG